MVSPLTSFLPCRHTAGVIPFHRLGDGPLEAAKLSDHRAADPDGAERGLATEPTSSPTTSRGFFVIQVDTHLVTSLSDSRKGGGVAVVYCKI